MMLRRLYDWTMAKAGHRHAEWWLALFAFMEASFFPIPPHPLLGLMCLAQPRKAVRFAAFATIGSVTGGMLGYAIGHFLYASIGAQLLEVLHLARSFPKAACYLREYGVEIIIIKGATPIPFKLLTITAGFIGMPFGTFLLASLVSRSISFMIVGVLFRLFGAPIKQFVDKYLGLVSIGFVVLVIAGFVAAAMLGGSGAASQKHCDMVTSLPG
ncbi:membrane-like protein [Novosphingobium nitrogenifigens DSM 19370]|uniref:Membrane-like protein n=2 Tax=Novosphingobium nitrogenifigens TaxID=378548 RepID=F1ZDK7_9SPHN|nr:membrane-like protein [Novosphingobium nitrogenifigens DSM 19370]